MKKIKKIITFALAILLVLSSMMSTQQVKAYTVYNKLEIENMQLNKARIKKGGNDSEGKHVETYWQQEPLDTYDKLTDITFARTVMEADEAGDYTFQIHCKNETGGGSIDIRLYINGTPYDITVRGSSYQTVNKTVPLKKGRNAIVLAWVNWGYFDYINYPSELKIVSSDTNTKYNASEAALNEIQLAPTTGFHNSDAELYIAPIEYNSGAEEWQGAATFNVNASADIKSMDLNYYVTEYSNGFAQLAMSVNGGEEVKIDLSGNKTNTKLTYSISTQILEKAGFKPGENNTIKFRQASPSAGKVGLYSIELKAQQVEDETKPEVKADRYEVENAYIIAGALIKKSESDNERWSGGSYIGEFAPANISKASQIDEYCSNIGYVQYKVNAKKSGYYKVTLGYATEIDKMTVYVTSGYEWSKVLLTSTGSWNNIGEKYTYVYLKKGENSLWVTGPSKEDEWVNYDYIDLTFEENRKIDTKKTVLFLDSKVSANSVQETPDEETTTENGGSKEKANSSLISPKTGNSEIVILYVAMMIFGGLAGICVVYRKKYKI